MTISAEECTPYLSLSLYRTSAKPGVMPKEFLAEVRRIVREAADKKDLERPTFPKVNDAELDRNGTKIAWGFYVEKRPPSWFVGDGLADIRNQIVVIARRGDILGILCSDGALRDAIARKVTRSNKGVFGSVVRLKSEEIRNAFVEDGVRTLWLSGAHRRSPIKPDSKVLSGLELESAIDPLGDQSFYFSSIRSTLAFEKGSKKRVVGASPLGNRIWLGPTASWDEFLLETSRILDRASTHSKQSNSRTQALAGLASPSSELGNVRHPYDLAMLIPEGNDTGVDGTPDKDNRWLQQFAETARFEIHPVKGKPDFETDVYWGNIRLGRLSYEFAVTSASHVRLAAKKVDGFDGKNKGEKEKNRSILNLCKKSEYLSIYFDTGHTFSRGQFYETRFRDASFERWQWVKMDPDSVSIGLEKPLDGQRFAVEQVGQKADKSLFGFIAKHWPNLGTRRKASGWLVCDDGSMESADFIHIDNKSSPPVVTLIHVKGSGSTTETRQISVADYEVVVGQAIKNIRHLDKSLLRKKLAGNADKKLKDAVWRDGVRQNSRDDVLEVLDRIGSNYVPRVCIFQPRARRAEVNKIRKKMNEGQTNAQVRRVQQLDALLLGAQADCLSMGAEFFVIADGDDL